MRGASLAILPVALLLAARPADGGVPLPPGEVVHLCPDARRSEGEACVFGFGPGRRLAVPWTVLEAPRTVRQSDPRVSTYGMTSENGQWPLGLCHPAGDCEGAVGRSGRRTPLPGRDPRITEQWSLCGRLAAAGAVEHRPADADRPCLVPTRAGEPVPFSLVVSTGGASDTRGFARSLAKTPTRSVELWRRCYPYDAAVQTCEVHGGRDGVAFTIYWTGRPEMASEAMFAAAASLFDRYVVEGTGLGR